jgi:flavin reductase (DIM6/NTAB) family NADH-FMN oxidoreductase RutF
MILRMQDLETTERQYWLQHLVAPRPIGFVSSIDLKGNANLSPFSFFNLFSAEPPLIIFSPSRRVRDRSVKHTLENVQQVGEIVINMVDYSMVEQASLSSCDYPRGTDEFVKAGFTRESALYVQPPMVRESPAKLECRIKEIKSLGEEGGAGQLVIGEVICVHIQDRLVTADNRIDQRNLDLVGRLGENWYCRTGESNLFWVQKPGRVCGIGMDALPAVIRNSALLTGNQLARLAGVPVLPVLDTVNRDTTADCIVQSNREFGGLSKKLQVYAADLLDQGLVEKAWQVLLLLEMEGRKLTLPGEE